MPVVTTLHTILSEPDRDQRKVLEEIGNRSDRLVVMSERGAEFLREISGVPEQKIDVIPHGIPDVPFIDPNFYKDQLGVEGKIVLLTFGLLSPINLYYGGADSCIALARGSISNLLQWLESRGSENCCDDYRSTSDISQKSGRSRGI